MSKGREGGYNKSKKGNANSFGRAGKEPSFAYITAGEEGGKRPVWGETTGEEGKKRKD